MTTTLQEQARALGDPTRHAIFNHLVAARRPLGVAELNEQFPLNHNAIRQHLAKLVSAALVVETTAPAAGRGRPRLVYEVSPAAESRWGVTGPYERLSRLLAEIIRTGLDPEEVGRRAADEFRIPSPSGDVVADVEPEVRPTRGGAEIILHNCPFATAALADRSAICALHLGIAEGLTDGTAGQVTELVGYDPRKAGCRLRIRLVAGDQADSNGVLALRGMAGRS
jgi:predicted ArsR family transcriptional regulator